jgi:hypothetical protein
MNQYNPFGVILGMGNVYNEPQYSNIGVYDQNRQSWNFPDAYSQTSFHNAAYRAGGYGRAPGARYRGYPPANQQYNDQEQAAMLEQLEFDGLDNAFAWRSQTMSEAELQEERARCEAEAQEADRRARYWAVLQGNR